MKTRLFLSSFLTALCLISHSILGFAQTEEDAIDSMRNEYNNWVDQEKKAFQDYVEKRDKEFEAYLKKEWRQMQLFAGKEPKRLPGPKKIPHYEKTTITGETQKIPLLKIRDIPEITPRTPELKLDIPDKIKQPPKTKIKHIKFDYYGKLIHLSYDPELHHNAPSEIHKNSIAAQFAKLSTTNYYPVVEQMVEVQRMLNLNDWGYFSLVHKFSETVSLTENEKNMLSWFLMIKSGYDFKLAYYKNKVFLLMPSIQQLYQRPYYTIDGRTYYLNSKAATMVFTYKKSYPGADRQMDLNMYKAINLPQKAKMRSIEFDSKTGKQSLDVLVSTNHLDFYNDYPQGDIQIYFEAAMPAITDESLEKYFSKQLKGLTEKEKVASILSFVQNAFPYQTDGQQFGREKFFFPDENFAYPYADCEDRSVLFAYLVRKYAGLETIGLNYDKHIATAVRFNTKVAGDYLTYKNNEFIVCDPTFINAPIGACMPEYKNEKPEVVQLVKPVSQKPATAIWQDIEDKGLYPMNLQSSAKRGNAKTCFFTGRYDDIIATTPIPELNDGGIVGAANSEGKISWIYNIKGEADYYPEHVFLQNDVLLISGYCYLKNKALSFACKYSSKGEALWVKHYKMTVGDSAQISYKMEIQPDGKLLGMEQVNALSQSDIQPVSLSDKGAVKLESYMYVPKYASIDTAPEKVYEVAKGWKETSEKYQKSNYDSSAASIIAFIESLQEKSLNVSGREILAALHAFNPSFRYQMANLYENIKNLDEIDYDNGLIRIKTKDNHSLDFGRLHISNNSLLRIKKYRSGNMEIFFLTGAYYKSIFKERKLNSIKLFKSTGDMIVDYDIDHNQQILSLKDDILD